MVMHGGQVDQTEFSAILMPGSAHVLSISAREEHARLLETRGCDTRVRYLKGFIFLK